MLVKLLMLYYLFFSVISAMMHIVDKRQATRARRRIREQTLHSIELLGGWPGAILITRAIHHKVAKRSYMWTLYAIAAAHLLGWSLLTWLATR